MAVLGLLLMVGTAEATRIDQLMASRHHHHKHHHNKEEKLEKAEAVKEANAITAKADNGLQALEQQDASLSDMLAFSKAISNGKTAQEAAEEEEKKQKEAEIVQKKLEEIAAEKNQA